MMTDTNESAVVKMDNEADIQPGAFAVAPTAIAPGASVAVNVTQDCKQGEREARRALRQARISTPPRVSGGGEHESSNNEGSNSNDAEMQPGAVPVAPDKMNSINSADTKQSVKARRADRRERIASRTDGNEAEKPGAVDVGPGASSSRASDNKQNAKGSRTEDVNNAYEDKPDLVIAAEISPDNADLEAQFDEKLARQANEIKNALKHELLQGVNATEVVVESKEEPPIMRRCVWVLLGLALVGVVVGVVVALTKKDAAAPTMAPMIAEVIETQDPTTSPTMLEVTTKFTQLVNLIGAVTPDVNFEDRTTPQYVALDWLANVDTWEVDIDSVDPQVFVERYVLALLFLSTEGESWRKDYNFLAPTSVCDWSQSVKGVICNGTGIDNYRKLDMVNVTSVRGLDMGTYYGTIRSEVPHRDRKSNNN
jgi:hypothetical protein